MCPNTPHFIVMPESVICHGGHFYAMLTIQDTIFGLYHMFVASTKVTNTAHSHDAHLLLQRMVIYIHSVLIKHVSKMLMVTATTHVPDVSTFEGTLDLFMLCVIMELGDLLNPLAYKKKYHRGCNCDHDQLCTIHAHGLSRELRKWWRTQYIFYNPVMNTHVDSEIVFKELLSQQIYALISYKKVAEESGVEGEVKECMAEVLKSLVSKYFISTLHFHGSPENGFEWSGVRYVVHAQQGGEAYTRCRYSTFVELPPFMMQL